MEQWRALRGCAIVWAMGSKPGLGRERCWDGEEELDSQEREEDQTGLGESCLLLWTLGSWAASAPPPAFLWNWLHRGPSESQPVVAVVLRMLSEISS